MRKIRRFEFGGFRSDSPESVVEIAPKERERQREVYKERKGKRSERIVIPAEKKSAVKYSAVPRASVTTEKCISIIGSRVSPRVYAHADGGNFGLTANTPVNSVGSLT